ncbi:hypothetical protein SETIT_7G274400v2 [Setaria italica]|uniref:Uncharacterized protein n=1 Tax=Setaria italica TaxID=4555 RepID=K3Y9Y0_SETIT|nr:uncharacterized protein LOC101778331 [Setaria italica]RCV35870.1 hypothetical protein SETIT_7G274400v2 [Setaria italica]
MYAMASAGGTEEPALFVKQGSKLHSKMLSKEAAAQLAVPSFRVYYSVASAGAVPFLWESQPGTPKNDSPSASALPPLTPPPSYYSADRGGAGGRSRKRRPGLIGAILPRIAFLRRPGRTAPCSSWSSSSWSSSSSNTSSMSPVFTVQSSPAARGSRGHRRAFSAGGAGDDAEAAPPRCFWTERDCCEKGVVRGCGVAVAVRNALATVVGGKPGHRATAA